MSIQDLNNNLTGMFSTSLVFPKKTRLGDLARAMQSVTEHAMSSIKRGVDYLKNKNLLWVICLSEIKIHRMPSEGETLKVYTWPGKEKLGMLSRRYVFVDGAGKECFRAASLFSLVDSQKRTMVLPSDGGIHFEEVIVPDEQKLPKMTVKGPETSDSWVHKAEPQEIDFNGHVNNAFYLDWAEDILRSINKNCDYREVNVWIQYAKEILIDETCLMECGYDEKQLLIKGSVNQENCFTIKIDS